MVDKRISDQIRKKVWIRECYKPIKLTQQLEFRLLTFPVNYVSALFQAITLSGEAIKQLERETASDRQWDVDKWQYCDNDGESKKLSAAAALPWTLQHNRVRFRMYLCFWCTNVMLLMYLLSSYSRASSRHQISGAREQHIQIFILPCKWVPSFPFLFGAAGTVIMQTNTCFKTKGTTYREEEISE